MDREIEDALVNFREDLEKVQTCYKSGKMRKLLNRILGKGNSCIRVVSKSEKHPFIAQSDIKDAKRQFKKPSPASRLTAAVR